MKKQLSNLLKQVKVISDKNYSDTITISTIAFDSREVVHDSLFVATTGETIDGHLFIDKAIESGAIVIVCEILPIKIDKDICYIQVENSKKALGQLASNFYDNPSEKLVVIGVTGTNGKTSTTTILQQLFTHLGYKVGLLSTINVQIGDKTIQSTHTTPNAVVIQHYMSAMVKEKCTHCFMEVSSHAIDQYRIEGIQFDGGVFTNITHEHIDYHKTFANYINTKKKFFDELPISAFALTNGDDKNGAIMMQNTLASKKTYAIKGMADYTVRIVESNLVYMTLMLDGKELTLNVVGEFNAYNVLASYGVARELGENKEEILLNLSKIEPIEGRINTIQTRIGKAIGLVDFAHTPDAVEKILTEIKKNSKTGKIITVIGCGGNRDVQKRPVMAKISTELSDRVILTSDNPRDEDPLDIINDMKTGIDSLLKKKSLVVIDRKEAIKTACLLADQNDIIVILGKGHEKYQEVKGVKTPFDDKEELMKNFVEIGL